MDVTYTDLANKTVLISGGAGGIGAATVLRFCQQGAKVAFVDISLAGCQATVEYVSDKTGIVPLFEVCDLRDIPATRQAVNKLNEKVNSFDVLVNNAGHDEAHNFEQVTPEYFDDRVSVNLRHQYFLAQQLAVSMREKGSGSIINLGSISWMLGVEGVSIYTTLKSAVVGLTKSLARELGHNNIRVNSIAPGWVLTERQLEKARQYPEKLDAYLQRQCIKEHLNPDDIARLCLWLASEQSARLTGQTIIYDGGVV